MRLSRRALYFFILSVFCFLSSVLCLQTSVFCQSDDQNAAYQKLLTEIRAVHQPKEFETNREIVRRHWEIGTRLNAYIPPGTSNHEIHELFSRTKQDLGKTRAYFGLVRNFARKYPQGPPAVDVPWSYFLAVTSVDDAKKREELLQTALAQHWDRRRLAHEVRKIMTGGKEGELPPLEAKPGIPGTYRIVSHNSRLAYDLGFSIFRDLTPEEAKKFKEGDIVRCGAPDPRSKIQDTSDSNLSLDPESCIVHPESVSSDLFTYRAQILKVLDGDTVVADLELGFGMATVRRMRLVGIDAPELITEAGPQSKAYLERLLSRESSVLSHESKAVSEDSPPTTHDILIHAEKIDKYNRSLADIWNADGVYVNRKLLDAGQAVRLEE